VLKLLDSRLEQTTWFAGDESIAADIMSVFSMTTMRTFIPFDLSGYPYILRYIGRVGERKA
jgi:glutathione S-transferase